MASAMLAQLRGALSEADLTRCIARRRIWRANFRWFQALDLFSSRTYHIHAYLRWP